MKKRSGKKRLKPTIFLAKNRKGTVLIENIIFIVLNLAYLSILVLFLLKQGSGAILLEQSYAKNIALLIDSSKPVMEMKLNMEDAMKLAEKNGVAVEDIVKIDENIVKIKLSAKGGYEYSFFNEVDISCYPNSMDKEYIFIINKKGSGNFCRGERRGEYGGAGASGTW